MRVVTTPKGDLDTGIFLKLPACDTEVFHGGYNQWAPFRDIFTAVNKHHPKLLRARKLCHIRYITKGEAGSIVKRRALNFETFNLTWDALVQR